MPPWSVAKKRTFAEVMAETKALQASRPPPESVPRGKLEALAPAPPHAALTAYSAAMDTYYQRVLSLVEKHVLSRLPVLGSGEDLDRTGLQLGLAALQLDMVSLAEKTRVPARSAAMRAGSNARREVERMLQTKLPDDGRTLMLAEDFAQRNVELVRRIASAQVQRIQKAIADHKEGHSMRRDILDATWVARNRSQLIGRDQLYKFQDTFVRHWSVAAGSTHYVYVDRRDERVRESHREHHGKIFSWTIPPSTGHPGTQWGCRCRAVPVEAPELQ